MIGKELAKALEDVHRDAERVIRAMRPAYEQYNPAERGIPWYVVARNTLHFNDGWEEVRVEIIDPDLASLTIQRIAAFDEDPKRLDRVIREITLGPRQALALLGFLKKHEAFLAAKVRGEGSNTTEG